MHGLRLPEDFRLGLRLPGPGLPAGSDGFLGALEGVGFRCPLDWAALQPEARGALESPLLDSIRRDWEGASEAGSHLVLSLHGGALPDGLARRGGWSDREAIGRFAEYGAAVARVLGDGLSAVVLLEDPLTSVRWDLIEASPLSPRGDDAFLRGTHIVNLALAECTRAIRAERPQLPIGRHVRAAPCEPLGDGESDADACERFHQFAHHWFLQPALQGSYPEALVAEFGKQRRDEREEDGELMQSPIDFVELDAGPRLRVEATHDDFGLDAIPRPADEDDLRDPERRAEALAALVGRVSSDLPDLPLEVSARPADDLPFSEWHGFHEAALASLCDAQDAGARVTAYRPWAPFEDAAPATGERALVAALRWVIDTYQQSRSAP